MLYVRRDDIYHPTFGKTLCIYHKKTIQNYKFENRLAEMNKSTMIAKCFTTEKLNVYK